MPVSVVVPWRLTDPAREASGWYVLDRLFRQFPDAEIATPDDPGDPFNRGRALNAGAANTTGDPLVFVDSDMVVPDEAFAAALDAVVRGAAMVVPFRRLIGLTGAASELVTTKERSPWGPWGMDQVDLEWDRRSTGGVNVIRRAVFEDVGGFDRRFAGWGGEDPAFASAVETLFGPVEWVAGLAVHLWHPHADDRGTTRTEANMNLVGRYSEAWGDRAAMTALVAEACDTPG